VFVLTVPPAARTLLEIGAVRVVISAHTGGEPCVDVVDRGRIVMVGVEDGCRD
jgi:hypothetical protein